MAWRIGSSGVLTFSLLAAVSVAAYAGYSLYQRKQKKWKPSKSPLALPVIDGATFFDREKNPEAYRNECLKVADALHKYGVAIIKDPRVNQADNDRFLDMLEKYFEISDGSRDARPEYHYQVGVTPSHVGESSLFLISVMIFSYQRDHEIILNSWNL